MSDQRHLIEVDGIECEHCVQRLRDVVGQMPALRMELVSPPRATVSLAAEHAHRQDEARKSLEDAGFSTHARSTPRPTASAAVPLILLAAAVLAVGLIGYGAYELYPRFELDAYQGVPLLLLAVGAGVAAFFSPCAFSLLLTLLARDVTPEHGGLARPLRFAAGMSAGALVFVLAVGAAIALGTQALIGDVTFTSTAGRLLRLAVGAFLVLMGLNLLGRLKIPMDKVASLRAPLLRTEHRQREQHPTLSYGIFGFSDLLTGFG